MAKGVSLPIIVLPLPACTVVPNGVLARISRSGSRGEPDLFHWYALTQCCIYVQHPEQLYPRPPVPIHLAKGDRSDDYTVRDANVTEIKYMHFCNVDPCPSAKDVHLGNGDSIIIDA